MVVGRFRTRQILRRGYPLTIDPAALPPTTFGVGDSRSPGNSTSSNAGRPGEGTLAPPPVPNDYILVEAEPFEDRLPSSAASLEAVRATEQGKVPPSHTAPWLLDLELGLDVLRCRIALWRCMLELEALGDEKDDADNANDEEVFAVRCFAPPIKDTMDNATRTGLASAEPLGLPPAPTQELDRQSNTALALARLTRSRFSISGISPKSGLTEAELRDAHRQQLFSFALLKTLDQLLNDEREALLEITNTHERLRCCRRKLTTAGRGRWVATVAMPAVHC